MTLLTPLGLLALLAIVGLIIIYIIKPNYQQKFISSTHLWKLSLKYRRKKVPINKLRNFLLILCQILILTACSIILAQPNQILKEEVGEPEVIAIIDSSASMRAQMDGVTRFERAVESAQKLTDRIFEQNGIVSVILASEKPAYLKQRITSKAQEDLNAEYDILVDDSLECSYATADIDNAIALCESVLTENPKAKIYLYTDTQYTYVPKEITLVNVSNSAEWNASILNATSVFEDPYYAFIVEVACYGADTTLSVDVAIDGANAVDINDKGESVSLTVPVDCRDDKTYSVIFAANPYKKGLTDSTEEDSDEYKEYINRLEKNYDVVCWMEKGVYSYHFVNISINEKDSFARDNSFELYDGLREVIKIQYASQKPNVFWPTALSQLASTNEGKWDIKVKEIKKGEEPDLQGYDFYIFEHTIPEDLPTDGVVFLVNPNEIAAQYGVRVGASYSTSGRGISPELGEEHPITKNLSLDRIALTRYTQLILDSSYTPLLMYEQNPLLAVRNDEDIKMVIMPFSLHYSTIAVTEIFPLFVYNIFEYFFPQTVNSNSFEVNEKVELNARGQELNVESYNFQQVFDVFPAYFTVQMPGTYILSQTTFNDKEVSERIYVRIPREECNIRKQGGAIADPYRIEDKSDFYKDLLLYLAASLVGLLFIEWQLKGRASM